MYQFKWLLQWNVFQDGNYSSVDGFLSVVGHPFLRLTWNSIDQLGGSIYWRHDCHSIFNQHIKGLNPSFTYRHHDMTLKLVTKQTSKEKYRKILTIKNMVMESGLMFKVMEIMFTCVVKTMGGHLWLYYGRYDKNIDIELHAQVLTLS